MKLSDYVKTSKNQALTIKKLAFSIGVSTQSIRTWMKETRFPRRKYWDKIVKATEGKVTIMDMAK